MFKINRDYDCINNGKGFTMTFSNGVTISVQFGTGNYCDNRDAIQTDKRGDTFCENAEIAVWKDNDEWITEEMLKYFEEEEDMVKGYCNANDVAMYIAWAASY